VSTEIARNE